MDFKGVLGFFLRFFYTLTPDLSQREREYGFLSESRIATDYADVKDGERMLRSENTWNRKKKEMGVC